MWRKIKKIIKSFLPKKEVNLLDPPQHKTSKKVKDEPVVLQIKKKRAQQKR